MSDPIFLSDGGVDLRLDQSSIGAAILSATAKHPDALAVMSPAGTQSYRQFRERAIAIAAYLIDSGLQPGEHIGLAPMPPREIIEIVIGCTLCGVVPVAFNPDWPREDTRRLAARLDVRRAFAPDPAGAVAHLIGPRGAIEPVFEQADKRLVPGKGAAEEAAVLAAASRLDPGAPWLVVFTAGSTATPKLCRVTNENILCKIAPFADRFALGVGSRIWLGVPNFQIGFLKTLVAALAVGATILVHDRGGPVEIMNFLEAAEVTHAYPIYMAIWQPMLAHPLFRPSRFPNLSHVCLLGRWRELRRAQHALPQALVMNTYGSAEEGGAFCLPDSHDPAETRLGSAGRPFPGHELRIVDPQTGGPSLAGEVGEIQVRGIGVVDAYPDTPQAKRVDGWLRTEDMGFIDAGGALHCLGRLTDMLSIGGVNVSGTTIEEVLVEHPGIANAQVVAKPDVILGEVARAFVELRPGHPFDARNILAFCARVLKPDTVPRYLEVVQDWPMSASKINKRALAARPAGPRLVD